MAAPGRRRRLRPGDVAGHAQVGEEAVPGTVVHPPAFDGLE
jgi:hypothetical protein